MYRTRNTVRYDYTSGQTQDIVLIGAPDLIEVSAFILPTGGANTDCFLRINAQRANMSSARLNNGTSGTSGNSSMGLARNGGILRVDFTLTPRTGARRVVVFTSSSIDSSGAIQQVWSGGSIVWNDIPTVIASFGFDLDTGMAFSAGSYVLVTT
jgi:hypothetical protein